jgi:hypothetical protein
MRETAIVSYKNGDREFKLQFSMLTPSKSLKFLIYMAKVLGAPASKAVGAFQGKADMDNLMNLKDEDVNFSQVGNAIVSLFDRLDENEVIEKLNLLYESVTLSGESIHVDHPMFDGRPDLNLKVAYKAMEVNYRHFLGENSGLFTKISQSLQIIQKSKESRPEQM